MDEEKKKSVANWLLVVAKILSYFASAFAGGVIATGCRNPALFQLSL